MILGDTFPDEIAFAQNAGRTTLDDMFSRVCARTPDAVALADSSHRETLGAGKPLTLSYAEADRIVGAIAARLRSLGLTTDAVVALQMPTSVEAVLAFLGVLRAGLIAMPLPLLWRRGDVAAALARVGAKGIVAGGSAGDADLATIALEAAADTFSVRAVCGFGTFGAALPDGLVPLDPLLAGTHEPDGALCPVIERPVNPAAHVAAVTFEASEIGPIAVGRSHVELLAAGLTVALEARLEPDEALVTTMHPGSLAGLACAIVPWLMRGGTLGLHMPFDADALGDQIAALDARAVAVPGPLAERFRDAGIFARADNLAAVLAVWRAPERLAGSADWPADDPKTRARLVDLSVFGETGLLAARRGADGRPAPIGAGPVTAPRATRGAALVAEITRTDHGTLAMRGAMVPRFPFPPGAERGSAPCLAVEQDQYVDTRHFCRVDKETRAMVVTAPPAGLVGIGGTRLALAAAERTLEAIDRTAFLLALPDVLMGQRLFGHAADGAAVRAALAERGAGALVVGAFRDRPAARSAA